MEPGAAGTGSKYANNCARSSNFTAQRMDAILNNWAGLALEVPIKSK